MRVLPTSLPSKPVPAQPQLTEFDAEVHWIARQLSLIAESDPRLRGRWPLSQLRDVVREEIKIDLPRSSLDGPVGRLIREGKIIQFPAYERPEEGGGDGRMRVFRATGVDQVTLADLMREAETAVDPEGRGRRGRRGDRRVETISQPQYDRMRTVARHIAFHLNPKLKGDEEAAFAAVGSEYLHWDPAEGPAGDWRRMLDLVRASRPPASQVETYVGAARMLLDLGATRGLLLRSESGERYLVPAAWAPVQARWIEAARHSGLAAVLGTNVLLAAIAQVLSPEVDPEALTREQTERVVMHIMDALLADGSLTSGQRTSVRRTIRRIMGAGLLPTVDVNGWDYRQRHRKAAWSSSITKAIAAIVAAEHRGRGLVKSDYEVWESFPFRELGNINNPFSLASAVDYQTATGRERKRLGFRRLGDFPRAETRKTSALSTIAWSEATVRIALDAFAMYIGWIARYSNVELESADLRDILTAELVEQFVDTVLEGEYTTIKQAQRVLVYIGLICSPCLEHRALKEKNTDLADCMYDLACLVTGKGSRDEDGDLDGQNLFDQLADYLSGDEDSIEVQRRQAKRLEDAFRDVLSVGAFDGLVLLFREARSAVLERLGVASTAELRRQWVDIAPRLRRTELGQLRALNYINVALGAPVRTRNHCELVMDDIVLQAGRLAIQIPAERMKVEGNGPYEVTLWTDDAPSGFDIDLWRIYEMNGGIRSLLLTNTRGLKAHSAAVWVNDFGRARTKRAEVLPATVNKMLKEVVELGAIRIGLECGQRQRLIAVVRNHSVRHAMGSKLIPRGEHEQARVLLHHANLDMLFAVYSDRDRTTTTGRVRAEIGVELARRVEGLDLVDAVMNAPAEVRDELLKLLMPRE